MKKIGIPLLSSTLLTLLPVVLTSLWVAYALEYEAILRHWPWYYWLIWTLVTSLTSALAITPPTYLAVILGYFLGYIGLVPAFLINLIAIYLVYLAVLYLPVRTYLGFLVDNPKAAQLLPRLQKNQLRVVFFAKLSPILPFTLTNLVLAMAGTRLSAMWLGGALGMIPRTLLAVWTGLQAKALHEAISGGKSSEWERILFFILLAISVVGLIQLFGKKAESSLEEEK